MREDNKYTPNKFRHDPEVVRAIFAMAHDPRRILSLKEIAEKFGTSRQTVSRIRSRQAYGEFTEGMRTYES